MNENQSTLTALTDAEAAELQAYEEQIREAKQTGEDAARRLKGAFIATGRALAAIRDRELYRGKYPRFEDYCADAWGYSDTHAYRLINAASRLTALQEAGFEELPTRESHVRALNPLTDEQAVEVWRAVLDANGSADRVTAQEVKKAASPFLPDTSPAWGSHSVPRAVVLADPEDHHPSPMTAAHGAPAPEIPGTPPQIPVESDAAEPSPNPRQRRGAAPADIEACLKKVPAADRDLMRSVLEGGGVDLTAEDARSVMEAYAEAVREDGAGELPSLVDLPQDSTTQDVMEDAEANADENGGYLPVLNGAPPTLEGVRPNHLLVSVPQTMYSGAPSARKLVVVPASALPMELDSGRLAQLNDEARRVGVDPRFNRTNESVDWAQWTWNPVTGCLHGCTFCYARDIALRFYPQGFAPTIHPPRLSAPDLTPYPPDTTPGSQRVFVGSMGDLFGTWVPNAFIQAVLDKIEAHPDWTFLLLTKYPRRLMEFEFPANAWVGTSVVEQTYVKKAEKAFAHVQAAVKWVSVEPMRERITFDHLDRFSWVVIGAQTKTRGAPAFQPEAEWVEHLKAQAREAGAAIYEKANLAVHLKEFPPEPARPSPSASSTSGDTGTPQPE